MPTQAVQQPLTAPASRRCRHAFTLLAYKCQDPAQIVSSLQEVLILPATTSILCSLNDWVGTDQHRKASYHVSMTHLLS